jgi:hypothetical protein
MEQRPRSRLTPKGHDPSTGGCWPRTLGEQGGLCRRICVCRTRVCTLQIRSWLPLQSGQSRRCLPRPGRLERPNGRHRYNSAVLLLHCGLAARHSFPGPGIRRAAASRRRHGRLPSVRCSQRPCRHPALTMAHIAGLPPGWGDLTALSSMAHERLMSCNACLEDFRKRNPHLQEEECTSAASTCKAGKSPAGM